MTRALGIQLQSMERTAENWRIEVQRILRDFHPAYRAQAPFSDRRIEVRRQLANGLWASHSYFVDRGRDYHQGFALLWSTGPEKSPYSLLRVGTRFFDRPLGEVLALDGVPRPAGLRDAQTWRSNSFDLLSRSLAVAEEELLPRYLALVKRGAERLARFFRTAGELVEGLPRRLPKAIEDRARLIGIDAFTMEPHRSNAWVVTATDILLAREPYKAIPAGLRHAAVVLARLEDLVHIAPELAEVARILGDL